MNPGDIFEVEIESMSYGSKAIARLQGENQKPMVIFVEDAIPGEKVKIRLTKKFKNFWEAELHEVVKASPHRRDLPCPVAESCGGCQWQHMNYDFQFEQKKQVLINQLTRSLHLPPVFLESLLELKKAPEEFGYRNRIQVRGDQNGIGFYAKKSHKIIYSDRCLIAHPKIQEKWSQFLREKQNLKWAKTSQERDGIFKMEWSWTPNSSSVQESLNEKHAAHGFRQINDFQNQVLKQAVHESVAQNELKKPKSLLLDLYGGTGNLSDQFEGQFDQIICVDVEASEAKSEDGSSFKNKTTVQKFFEQDEIDVLLKKGCSVVIADPPREGLKDVAKTIANLNAEIVVLVSCDPSTLARDLREFLPTYQINKIVLIDLFPQTFHIESVVTLIHAR